MTNNTTNNNAQMLKRTIIGAVTMRKLPQLGRYGSDPLHCFQPGKRTSTAVSNLFIVIVLLA